MSSAKILITGLANTGKTSLLKPLKNALVISRDGKPFSLELIHVNIPDFIDENNGKIIFQISNLLDIVEEKLEAYKTKSGKYPDTLVFDSVSRIFTDIETSCSNRFKGYDVWSNVNTEINQFLSALTDIQNMGINIILIAHAVFDVDAKKFVETCKGSFAKIGGFLSTVDYAINIDIVGNKRIVTHKGMNLSRTLIEDMPEKQNVNEFNLQEYIEKIKAKSKTVTEKWSI